MNVSKKRSQYRVRGELLLKLLKGADKNPDSESANGIIST